MHFHDQWLVAAAISGIGVITFCLCLPLIYRKVPMNYFYGVRLPQSFISTERWYEINEYGGRILARWSFFMMVSGLVRFILPSGFFSVYTAVAVGTVVISLFVSLFQIIRWARATRQP
jgi:hypothetical protein